MCWLNFSSVHINIIQILPIADLLQHVQNVHSTQSLKPKRRLEDK